MSVNDGRCYISNVGSGVRELDTVLRRPKIDPNNFDDLREKLSSIKWRMSNLYSITDKDGRKVKFKPNETQEKILNSLHKKNVILKARQLGCTTLIQILSLDQCLFVPGSHVGLIAHRMDDAIRIFREKAMEAYDNLPDFIKEGIPLERRSATEMRFKNGSSFVVGVSLRSGTYQIVHVSEFGKVSAQWPEKAREIKTGALNTVSKNGYVFIESTAEGQHGEFYDFCMEAIQNQKDGIKLTSEHYKFLFYPWFDSPEYRMDPLEAKDVHIPEKFQRYFQVLHDRHQINLTPSQKAWYVLKAKTQHEDLKREMPSTSAEAFEAIVENAIYGDQIGQAYDDGRIGKFSPVPGLPAYSFWDIGIADATAFWIIQFLPRNVRRLIGYYSGTNLATPHYTNWLQKFAADKGITYAGHILPHDGKNRDKLTGESYERGVERLTGVPTRSVERRDINLGINEIRNIFPFFEIDEEGCDDGLRCLKAYQWDVDEKIDMAKRTPKHNWASHGSDAARTSAFFRTHLFNQGNTTYGI